MKRQSSLAAGVCTVLAWLGCGQSPSDDAGPGNDTGIAKFELTLAPTEARCLVIIVTPQSSAAVTRMTSLVPEQSTVLSLSGLPTGQVTFTAEAFTQPCAEIAGQPATWVSEPVTATLQPGTPIAVTLSLRRVGGGGQATVVTDFPSSSPRFHLFAVENGLQSIATGPDGALWFTSYFMSQIGRIETSGDVTRFQLATGQRPQAIAAGPDGAIWFSERSDADASVKIGRVTTDGVLTEFAVPSAEPVAAMSMAVGGDGALWFVETFSGKIGRITTSGVLSERMPPPPQEIDPTAIAAGSDGSMWFTDGPNRITRLTPAGEFTSFMVPTLNAGLWGIAAGPDGAIWFTENNADKIGRIDPASGLIAEFDIPSKGVSARSITAGPDGNVWFTEFSADRVGRVTPDGTITEFVTPPSRVQPPGAQTITAGPDGNLWYVKFNNQEVVQVDI